MASKAVTIRNAVYTAINSAKGNEEYVINTFNLTKTYFPQQTLEELQSTIYVRVVAMALDEDRQTRGYTKEYELPVHLGVQRAVDPSATTTLDSYVQLVEELADTCADDELVSGSSYVWIRTEALKDSNGLPYQFGVLREHHTFEAYFTAFYKYLV